ncbi:adenine phosphoribosyltransferase [Lycorma delicatula]|uniref:adenine phosphoribosyltransferase n=1 Tax=Lycorma delicatula TaxID=130591 RepID=UPI003F50FD5B
MSVTCDDKSHKLQIVREAIGVFPHFPKPGIIFRDVFSVLRDPKTSSHLFELLNDEASKLGKIDFVVGLESRGFLFGLILARDLGVGFVPIRKKGKLPGNLKQVSFNLEYGNDVFEIQEDSISTGQRVLVVDDLLATGGTLSASCKLLSELGAEIVQCLVVIELNDLKGRSKVPVPVKSLVQF